MRQYHCQNNDVSGIRNRTKPELLMCAHLADEINPRESSVVRLTVQSSAVF